MYDEDAIPFSLLEPFHLAITTRVMAKRQVEERKRYSQELDLGTYTFFLDETPRSSRRSSYNGRRSSVFSDRRDSILSSGRRGSGSRRPSLFLEGAAIPNSVVRGEMKQPEPIPQEETDRHRERDEYVANLLERLRPKEERLHSIYDESVDPQEMDKIKKELRRRSLSPSLKQMSFSLHETDSNTLSSKSTNDPWSAIREKRRITRRTTALAPLAGQRRSTHESIRNAIENSKLMKNLIDPDYIQPNNIAIGKELSFPKYSFEVSQPNLEDPSPLRSSFISRRKRPKRVSIVEAKGHVETQTSFIFDDAIIKELLESRNMI